MLYSIHITTALRGVLYPLVAALYLVSWCLNATRVGLVEVYEVP